MLLPPLTDPEACAEKRSDPQWVANVCAFFEQRLGLEGPAVPLPTSSAVLARFGESVLKLYFPIQADEARREEQLLTQLTGQLPIDTPALVDKGEVNLWRYHVTTAVPGQPLTAVWGDASRENRIALGRELGCALADLHRLRPPGPLALTWPVWSRVRVAGAIDQHRRGGCPRHLLEQLPGFLHFADLSVGRRGIGLVHTAISPEHLKVERRGEHWSLCGLFGFADAQVAPLDYEFGPVGIHFGAGDAEVFGAVLDAYGLDATEPELARRLFAMALIHPRSSLGAWITPDLDGATLEALASRWFATR